MLHKLLLDGKGTAGAEDLKESQKSCWFDAAADGGILKDYTEELPTNRGWETKTITGNKYKQMRISFTKREGVSE